MIHLVLKRSGTVIDVFGAGGEPLSALPLRGLSQGSVVPLQRAAVALQPGHYLVSGWKRGGEGEPARLELADLDRSAEARLIDAASARRSAASSLLDVRGIAAPTGALRGRRDAAIYGAPTDAVPTGGGLAVEQAALLRLIDRLEADPAHGTVVLTVAGDPQAAH